MVNAQTEPANQRNLTNQEEFDLELKKLEADLTRFKSIDVKEGNKQDYSSSDTEQDIRDLSARNLKLIHQFNSLINSSTQQKVRIDHDNDPCFVSNYDQKRVLNKLTELKSQILKLQTQLNQDVNYPNSKDKYDTKPTKFKFKKPTIVQTPTESEPTSSIKVTSSKLTATAATIQPIQSKPINQPFDLNSDSQFIFCRPPQPIQPLHSISLSDLSNLVIDLRNLVPHLSALFLSRIHHLALIGPPLSGSTSLNTISHALICLVSQQVRICQCNDLTLLMYTSTNPVIESSIGIKIGAFPEEIFPLKDYAYSIINEANSKHNLPKDFDFPNSTQDSVCCKSPNYSILSKSAVSNQDLLDFFSPYQPSSSSCSINNDPKLSISSPASSCDLTDQVKAALMKL